METAINHQSIENLLQNYEYFSIIIVYKQFIMFNGRIQKPIRLTCFLFSSSVFKSESSQI
ncbi:hypothetical protein Hanom_Chr16g01511271 [Helianthus anomalus]